MEAKKTILIVDDELSLLEYVRLALESAGYRVITAFNGQEALRLLKQQPVNLILADIAMPELNGYQLYERVCENPEWVKIPFIFLTGRSLDTDIMYGKELGVDDYLVKPIEVKKLLAIVQGKLRRAQQLAASLERAEAEQAATAGGEGDVLVAGRLKIDSRQHRAWMDEELLQLSAREFRLLDYMAHRINRVISPQELIQVTHKLETDFVEAGNLLRPLIRTLRRKLGYGVGQTGCVENVRGVGYRFVAPK